MDDVDGPTDVELLQRILNRDASAFSLLYDRHSRAAYGLAFRILQDAGAAEDVVQDAFLTLWRQSDQYGSSRGTVRTWLLAIVHHRSIDRIRSRHDDRQTELDEVTLPAAASDTWEEARQNVEGEQVRQALLQLPPDQQRSITLAYFNGYTHDEISRLLNVPLGTVKGRLRMGLQKMRGHLRAQGMEAS